MKSDDDISYGHVVIPDKVRQYESFLNDVLKNDLRKILDGRDRFYSEMAEYEQLKSTVERFQDGSIGCENVTTKVDIGCNIYMNAKIPDASKIFIAVGFGFFLELTHVEALKFIKTKCDHLQNQIDRLTLDAGKIQANIKIVIEGLRELQGISDTQTDKPQRDICF